jgi:hypothetical protein
MTGQHCTATRAYGKPCKAWAVHGTDPPRCSAHRSAADWGAPRGNQNATKHGYYAACPDQRGGNLPEECPAGLPAIDHIIDLLYQRQLQLDDYIDQVQEAATLIELTHLLRIYGQNASRLGRLLRDRRALSGDAADGISGAIAAALDELSTELGTDLT